MKYFKNVIVCIEIYNLSKSGILFQNVNVNIFEKLV